MNDQQDFTYVAKDAEGASKIDQQNSMVFILFEGQYTNRMNFLEFKKPLKDLIRKGDKVTSVSLKEQQVDVYQYHDFASIGHLNCRFDLDMVITQEGKQLKHGKTVYNYEAKITQSPKQMETTGRNERMSVPCIAEGATLVVNSTTITEAVIDSLRLNIWMYATAAAILQLFVIYFSNKELKKFDHILGLRFRDLESQGQNLFSYAK